MIKDNFTIQKTIFIFKNTLKNIIKWLIIGVGNFLFYTKATLFTYKNSLFPT